MNSTPIDDANQYLEPILNLSQFSDDIVRGIYPALILRLFFEKSKFAYSSIVNKSINLKL
ncbi:MAG: hypothetical protein HC917_20845 [Richelia sp. SM2_1_7]|nr:hypothetical protein [Richelia sp. SM2_1_7]